MAKVVDLASRRECQHMWEDGEIGAGIAVRVCTKCGLGHTVGEVDSDDVMARAVARCEVLQQENDRLRNVIRTGGAMYRLERAAMGIPGGHDPDQDFVRVVDVAGDGTGPWKLFVGDFGVAAFPVHRDHNPREYAEEVARVIREALRSPLPSEGSDNG